MVKSSSNKKQGTTVTTPNRKKDTYFHTKQVLHLGTYSLLASYFLGGSGFVNHPRRYSSLVVSAYQTPSLPHHQQHYSTFELHTEVLKQNGQISNNSGVPAHLWDTIYFLRVSIEQPLLLPQNLRRFLALIQLCWRYQLADSLMKAIKNKMDPNITYHSPRWVKVHMQIPGQRHESDWIYQ